jgi:ribosome-binding protein aMBF1 (putative translation factor)
MKKDLPSRASLKTVIETLKTMPEGAVIQGADGALDQATQFLVQDLEQGLSEAFLTENIGMMLRQARLKSGLTGTELAARLGLSKVRISQLERIGSDVEVSTLARVAGALGYDLQLQLVERKA